MKTLILTVILSLGILPPAFCQFGNLTPDEYHRRFEIAMSTIKVIYPNLLGENAAFYENLSNSIIKMRRADDPKIVNPEWVLNLADQIAGEMIAKGIDVRKFEPDVLMIEPITNESVAKQDEEIRAKASEALQKQNASQDKECTLWELHQAQKLPVLIVNPMKLPEFREFRSICLELMTCNRPWFSKMVKNMAIGSKLTGDKPELTYIWDHSPEFNLAIIFAMVAKNNGIMLGETEKSDLDARVAGMSKFMKNKEHVTFVVDLCDVLKK